MCKGNCPEGYYCPTSATTSELLCPAGSTCPEGTSVPSPCALGSWSNTTGLTSQSQCMSCPAGSACAVGSTVPSLCGQGHYTNATDEGSCSSCAAGEYQDEQGQTKCQDCPLGSYCPEGAATPIFCPPGTIGSATKLAAKAACSPGPKGSWCTAGRAVACLNGYYQPFSSATNETACLKCHEHSTTAGAGATSSTDCECEAAANFVEHNGKCVCAAGFGLVSAGGAERCDPCALGTFKSELGNGKCNDCPIAFSTTTAVGMQSSAYCVCQAGYFLVSHLNVSVATSHSCYPCADAMEPGHRENHACATPGATLEHMPQQAGYWRQRAESRYVRACLTPEACTGGDNISSQCIEGHGGPYCAVCQPGFHGRGDGVLCGECVGSAELSITGTLVGGLSGFMLLVLILYRTRSWYKRVIDKLKVRVAQSSAPSKHSTNIVKNSGGQKEQVERLLKAERPCLYFGQRWLSSHSVSVGVKFRILLSLHQVLNGIGIVFDIPYPKFYIDILRYITFLDIDLPNISNTGIWVEPTSASCHCFLHSTSPCLLLTYSLPTPCDLPRSNNSAHRLSGADELLPPAGLAHGHPCHPGRCAHSTRPVPEQQEGGQEGRDVR